MVFGSIINGIRSSLGANSLSESTSRPSFAKDWMRTYVGNQLGINPQMLNKDTELYRAYRRVGIASYTSPGSYKGQNEDPDEVTDDTSQTEQEEASTPSGSTMSSVDIYGLRAGAMSANMPTITQPTATNSRVASNDNFDSPLRDLINFSRQTNELLGDIVRIMNMEQIKADAAREEQNRQQKEAMLESNTSLGAGALSPDVNDVNPEESAKASFDKLYEAIDELIEQMKESGSGGGSLLGEAAGIFGAKKVANAVSKRAAKSAAKDVLEHNGVKYTKYVDDAGKAVWRDSKGRFAKDAEKVIAEEALESSAKKSLIKRIAEPLIEKAGIATLGKSIPVLGAAVGIGFAINRLMDGDVVGAGLDAVSGLGGPLTAIPALIASIARDVYHDVYGVEPEADSQIGERLAEISGVVKEMVGDTLKSTAPTASAATVDSGSALSSSPVQSESSPALSSSSPESSSSATSAMVGAGVGAMASSVVNNLITDSSTMNAKLAIIHDILSPGTPTNTGSTEGTQSQSQPTMMAQATPDIQPHSSVLGTSTSQSQNTSTPLASNQSTPVLTPPAATPVPTEPKTSMVPVMAMQNELNSKPSVNVIDMTQAAANAINPKMPMAHNNPSKDSSFVPDPTYYGAGTLAPQLYFRA